MTLARHAMSTPTMIVDDRGVRRKRTDGTEEAVTWDQLAEVAIITTGAGPFAEDVFFRTRRAERPRRFKTTAQ